MRMLRILGLVVISAVTGVLSGTAAEAAPTTAAIVAAEALPSGAVTGRAGPATASPASPAASGPAASAAGPAPAPMATPALTAPVVSRVAGTPCRSTARACIELSSNRAWLISNGIVQYGPVPITHGREGWRTPPGTFAVTFKSLNHRSSLFNDAPMPYSVFFNGGIAFHQGSLTQESHGCIHLSRTAARTFFTTLNGGDVVQVVT